MNIRDLKYLVALLEHHHFGKAAKACFVSQPALSMQIKKLEAFLEVQLIERNNKTLIFTEIGKALAYQAKLILQHTDDLITMAKLAKDPYQGTLKLGIIPTLAPYLLPRIIPNLSKAFPNLQIFLFEEKTDALIEKLLLGRLDTAIMALPVLHANFHAESLFTEEFLLAVPKNHPLSQQTVITQNALANQTVLLLEEGHCLREQALAVCHMAQAQESENFKGTSLETLRHMVASGIGITLMPQLACHPNEGICYLPFAPPKPNRIVGMVWRHVTAKHNMLLELTTQIQQIMA